MSFRPTDEIAVHWRLRGPHFERFGSDGSDNSLHTRYIYGEIKQDWGTVLVGRISDDLDHYGLSTLGYEPGNMFTGGGPFDRADMVDGVRWTNRWDNGLQLMAQYGKIGNNGADKGQSNFASDQDFDRIQAEAAYFWDGGGAALNVIFDRDATNSEDYNDDGDWVGRGNGDVDKTTAWYVNPAFMHSWGDFSVHFEGKAGWGKTEYVGRNGDRRYKDTDSEGYGFYLDADYNYGPGNVTLMGWYVSGNKATASLNEDGNLKKNKALVDLIDGNFYPLLVAYNYTSLGGAPRTTAGTGKGTDMVSAANDGYRNFVAGNYDTVLNAGVLAGTVNLGDLTVGNFDAARTASKQRFFDASNPNGNANHWAIAFNGNHAFTDDIAMHYGLGYLALSNPNYKVVNKASFTQANAPGQQFHNIGYKEQDKDLGFEIDLGFTFQLLDNLTFDSTFGYMFTGDAYKSLKGYKITDVNDGAGTARVKAVWEDSKDAYIWANTLTFAF